jgi:hypothetical protein
VRKNAATLSLGQKAVVLIVSQGSWLSSKHSTRFKVFFDSRIEISMPNNPHYHILKVSLVTTLSRNGCQSWKFSVQIIKALCCCPSFLVSNSSFGANTPSSSGNVYLADKLTKSSCPILKVKSKECITVITDADFRKNDGRDLMTNV